MRFATIEVADIKLAQEVIQQAIINLGDHAKITSIAIDCGFMDGPLLHWINSKENNPNSKTLVILTNGPVDKPFKVYNGYDARNEIENSLFHEAKQAWAIQRPSKNTKAGFRVHVYLTILTMALTTAYQDWMDEQDKLEKDGRETGIRKFRKKSQRGKRQQAYHL